MLDDMPARDVEPQSLHSPDSSQTILLSGNLPSHQLYAWAYAQTHRDAAMQPMTTISKSKKLGQFDPFSRLCAERSSGCEARGRVCDVLHRAELPMYLTQ